MRWNLAWLWSKNKWIGSRTSLGGCWKCCNFKVIATSWGCQEDHTLGSNWTSEGKHPIIRKGNKFAEDLYVVSKELDIQNEEKNMSIRSVEVTQRELMGTPWYRPLITRVFESWYRRTARPGKHRDIIRGAFVIFCISLVLSFIFQIGYFIFLILGFLLFSRRLAQVSLGLGIGFNP